MSYALSPGQSDGVGKSAGAGSMGVIPAPTSDNKGPGICTAFHRLSDIGLGGGQKRCSKCGVLKPLAAFTRDKKSADGRYSSCKACGNARVKAYNAKHPEKRKAADRRAYAKRRDKALRQFRQWAEQHPLANKARQAVHRAVEAGRLVMPDTCDLCYEILDGHFHCHHPDYAHPLEGTTLCHSCHRTLHWQEKQCRPAEESSEARPTADQGESPRRGQCHVSAKREARVRSLDQVGVVRNVQDVRAVCPGPAQDTLFPVSGVTDATQRSQGDSRRDAANSSIIAGRSRSRTGRGRVSPRSSPADYSPRHAAATAQVLTPPPALSLRRRDVRPRSIPMLAGGCLLRKGAGNDSEVWVSCVRGGDRGHARGRRWLEKGRSDRVLLRSALSARRLGLV